MPQNFQTKFLRLMNRLPALRNENLVMQELETEILLYDIKTDQAYSLNEICSIVYRACGERMTIEDLKRQTDFTDELILLTLEEMRQAKLLAEDFDRAGKYTGIRRREIIRQIALNSAVALPAIASITAPAATNAASTPLDPSCGGVVTSTPCRPIDCFSCCSGGAFNIVIIGECRACRCL